MSYYCHYKIIDKETKKIEAKAYNHACFSSFTYYKNTDFQPGRYMEVYSPVDMNKMTEEELQLWCKQLTKVGLPVEMSKVENVNDLGITKACYAYTFDFDKYQSKRILKIALHIFRYCYEEALSRVNMCDVVLFAQRLKKEYPKYSIIFCFSYALMAVQAYGHAIFYSKHKLIRATDFKAFISKLIKSEYNDSEINEFCAHFKRDFDMETKPEATPEAFINYVTEYNKKIKTK